MASKKPTSSIIKSAAKKSSSNVSSGTKKPAQGTTTKPTTKPSSASSKASALKTRESKVKTSDYLKNNPSANEKFGDSGRWVKKNTSDTVEFGWSKNRDAATVGKIVTNKASGRNNSASTPRDGGNGKSMPTVKRSSVTQTGKTKKTTLSRRKG